jgi:hypothetical protein
MPCMILTVMAFFTLVLPAAARAGTITDYDWDQGTLTSGAINDNGMIRLDYDFGSGKDGSFNGNFESKAPAWRVGDPATISAGTSSVTLSATPSGLSAGDKVLLINLQGTSSDYSNVGNYEILDVSAVSGAQVTFGTGTVNAYGSPSTQEIFLQRVPQYSTAIISTMTTSAWNPDSLKTGVIAFMANSLSIAGPIIVSGLGFVGGGGYMQGESIAGAGGQSQSANVGGGGGGSYALYDFHGWYYWSGGGGGGGYGTAGGSGSETIAFGKTGAGGDAYSVATKLYLGSGGGGGGSPQGTAQSGGRGGGAVIIYARTLTGSGQITANGANGGTPSSAGDSGSGGGSGGAVVIRVSPTSGTTSSIAVSGGAGGGNNGGFGGAGGAGGSGYASTGTREDRFPEGSYMSKVFDSGLAESAIWTNMTVSLPEALPANSQVKAYYHICAAADCSDKTTWTECGTLTSGSVLRCDIQQGVNVGRYFQYKLDIMRSTTDTYASPSVGLVSMDYKTADNNGPSVTITGAPSGWVNTDQTATLTCADSGPYVTGCDSQSYMFKTYTDTASLPASCPTDYAQYQPTVPVSNQMPISSQTWVCGAAKDIVGNWNYTTFPLNFSIDKVPPTADIANESAAWVKSNVLLFNCSDGLSGCQQTMYYTFVPAAGSDCQSGGTQASGSITVSSDHNDYVCLRVSDNAGNTVTTMSSQLMVDVTTPVTADDVNPETWYGSPAMIKLTCSDSLSGCSRTNYCIDNAGGTCVPYLQGGSAETSLDVTCPSGQQNCSRIVRYYSEDAAGNANAVKSSATIRIDMTLPTCTMTSPTSPYTTTGLITVSWQAASPGSPVSSVIVEQMVDSGTWMQLTSSQSASGSYPISNAANGATYSFRCKAANQMGVESSYSSVATITVDTSPPTVSISAAPISSSLTFIVSWSGQDSETGIANYTLLYRAGSSSYSQWQVFQSATSALFGQDGLPVYTQNGNTYTFRARAADMAGNIRESGEVSVLVDTAKPTCTVQDMPSYQPSRDFTVRWSGTDSESGIREYVVEQRTGTGTWFQLYAGQQTSRDMLNMQDGIYRFRCRATDNANNTGELSAEKSTTVDLTSPDVQITFSSSVYVNENHSIGATVSDALGVGNVTLYYNGNEIPGTVTVNPNQSLWEVTWTLPAVVTTGTQSFTIRVQDSSGKSYDYTREFLVAYCLPGDTQTGCMCGSGVKTCTAEGVWSECLNVTVQPTAEVCNGIDDDCDGIVDDVDNKGSIQATRCQCFGSSLLAVQNEVCNGIDDDCDGAIDENGNCCNNGDTQSCGTDVGICRNKRKICTNQVWGPCEWEQGPASSETCGNSLDDDCDGSIDEDCGTCADSDADGYGYPASNLCMYPGQDCADYDPYTNPGILEVCDGMDNNCDGQIDEGLDCSTCNNGIQDGMEEGVDCGGDCPACFVWGWLWLTAGGVVILLILAFLWLHMKRQGRELTWETLKEKWTAPK